jgi:hypothetical protein
VTVQGSPGRRTVADDRAQRSSALATTACVLGLASAILALIPLAFVLSFPLGALAVVLGALAWIRAGRNPDRSGKGLAQAALILGAIGIAIAALHAVALDRALEEFAQAVA